METGVGQPEKGVVPSWGPPVKESAYVEVPVIPVVLRRRKGTPTGRPPGRPRGVKGKSRSGPKRPWGPKLGKAYSRDALEKTLREKPSGSMDLIAAIMYAADHAPERRVDEELAPNRLAFGLLMYARENWRDFVEKVLPKAMAVRGQEGGEEERREGHAKQVEEIEKVLKQYREIVEEKG